MVKYEYKDYKTIINKLKYTDSWFWCRYTLNPYQGCEHACIYCDSRSFRYFLHESFDQVIYIKTVLGKPIGKALDERLSRARTLLPDVVALGGTIDSYQPAEAEYGNTRQVLQVLLKHKYPVFVSTKSDLIQKDLDLFEKINEVSMSTIAFTITTFNEEVMRFLEPRAPSSENRIKCLEHIKKEHPKIQAGVNLIPVVPYLTDDDENLEEVVRRTKEAGADFLLFGGGMSMRDNQAIYFMKKLEEKYPDLVEKYDELFGGNYAPKKTYLKKIHDKILQFCKKYSIKYRIERFIPKDFRKLNYQIGQHLCDKSYNNQIQGKPYSNLLWAGLNISNLKESIQDVANRKELKKIKNVDDEIIEEIKPYLKVKGLEDYFNNE